ncbi:hypothetical protein DFH07DRAFT_777851 [Mycena maculata]|uniref:Uncharacterized protein n=1 Tax=Mycena maculata TaxID=230809 RepID=A0AAD7N2Z2_9AGAR|nr:hypothetical protein DFH07DRAFT_777851 [Mycena maculata]
MCKPCLATTSLGVCPTLTSTQTVSGFGLAPSCPAFGSEHAQGHAKQWQETRLCFKRPLATWLLFGDLAKLSGSQCGRNPPRKFNHLVWSTGWLFGSKYPLEQQLVPEEAASSGH